MEAIHQADVTNNRHARVMQMDWTQLKVSVADCAACPLHQTRTHSVFGAGDENADWLWVGESPGVEEDANGAPFVGQVGKLLDNMLAAISLKRDSNVYITNIVKCHPPANHNPENAEALQCHPYLARQIELIQPRLIIALGNFASQSFLNTDATVASLRGKLHQFSGIPLIVTYHPSYLLQTQADKTKAWEDLCFAKATMQRLLQ
ncbi:uracil-DNA glycosylase [Nitrosomonadaceae bacterium]|nr:uracil-DNA glycosylase [Nitrosomonadaceae bacterium]